MATIFAGLHREHGVDLRLGATFTGISRTARAPSSTLADGDPVACDLVVVGIGIEPVTELASAAGLTVDNGIRTDDRLRTSSRDVYAAGDVANADHPVLGRPDPRRALGHRDPARQGGRPQHPRRGDAGRRAAVLLHRPVRPRHGVRRLPGPDGYDRVVLRGDTDGRVFTAWWLREGLVVAGMHANDWDAIADVRRIVGLTVDADRLADENVPLATSARSDFARREQRRRGPPLRPSLGPWEN